MVAGAGKGVRWVLGDTHGLRPRQALESRTRREVAFMRGVKGAAPGGSVVAKMDHLGVQSEKQSPAECQVTPLLPLESVTELRCPPSLPSCSPRVHHAVFPGPPVQCSAICVEPPVCLRCSEGGEPSQGLREIREHG